MCYIVFISRNEQGNSKGRAERDEACEQQDTECILCMRSGRTNTVHSLEELEAAIHEGDEDVEFCRPAPWIESARGMLPAHRNPFSEFRLGLERHTYIYTYVCVYRCEFRLCLVCTVWVPYMHTCQFHSLPSYSGN
jgi:hypothetical protein